jgi:hypothetical protein
MFVKNLGTWKSGSLVEHLPSMNKAQGSVPQEQNNETEQNKIKEHHLAQCSWPPGRVLMRKFEAAGALEYVLSLWIKEETEKPASCWTIDWFCQILSLLTNSLLP